MERIKNMTAIAPTVSSVVQYFSPKTSSGSFAYSIIVHVTLAVSVVWLMSISLATKVVAPPEDTLDLGYQTFDEPPQPVKEVKRVVKSVEPVTPVEKQAIPDNTPKEMQDEKSDIAGTQKAAPQVAQLGNESNGTAEATPYYKIKPKYPTAALQAGTEGWVLMKIDINEQGEVENIRVIDGEQRNMFQAEARRAVEKWKYRPFTDASGKPYRKVDHQVKVEFKLNDSSVAQNDS